MTDAVDPTRRRRRNYRRLTAGVLGAALVGGFGTYQGCHWASAIRPPPVRLPTTAVERGPQLLRHGRSWALRRGNVFEVGLVGEPAERGAAMSRLLRGAMLRDEGELYEAFSQAVPFGAARWAIVELGRWRFRNVERWIPEAYRQEIAALAAAFAPDPFERVLPSYHRFVFLYTVYDIALSFEKSPLIGCTTFTIPPSLTDVLAEVRSPTEAPVEAPADPTPSVPPSPTEGRAGEVDWEGATAGHAFLARNFDFEAGDSFDRDKVVFVVREPGKIPFASVGWPGFVGVVSGMNREGVALVVHGGRAGTPRPEGVPVVFGLREALTQAHSTDEAVRILQSQPVMVSHIVIVSDPSGATAVVERAPGTTAFVRTTRASLATTNHFEGPLAHDPRDEEVRLHTSTLARRQRGDELVRALPAHPGVKTMVGLLRDRTGPNGLTLPLGDRRAIDALIATHGVVFDLTARALWVSESPHLLGRFVRFDLARLLADDYDPAASTARSPADPTPRSPADPTARSPADPTPRSPADLTGFVPADPLLVDGTYELRKLDR